jgi:hypothetical protein
LTNNKGIGQWLGAQILREYSSRSTHYCTFAEAVAEKVPPVLALCTKCSLIQAAEIPTTSIKAVPAVPVVATEVVRTKAVQEPF